MTIETMAMSSRYLMTDHDGARAFRKALGIVAVKVGRNQEDSEESNPFERLMHQRIGAMDRPY